MFYTSLSFDKTSDVSIKLKNMFINYVLQLFDMPQEAPLDFFTAGKLAASLINSL